jgi:hypothetical protein
MERVKREEEEENKNNMEGTSIFEKVPGSGSEVAKVIGNDEHV